MTFKFQGKVFSTPNLEKKLKRMKISIDDIEIIDEPKIVEKDTEETNGVKKYYFKNPSNGYTLVSIYNECPNGYEPI